MTTSGPSAADHPAVSPPDGIYRPVIEESSLAFEAKAFTLIWVRGQLPVVSGRIEIQNGLLSGTGEVSAAQVDTGLRSRDWHLRTSHYLHTKRHPSIRVSIKDANVTARVADCEVVVRDTPATIPLELSEIYFRNELLYLHVNSIVDRTAYPMWPPPAGVSRLVHVDLTVVAKPEAS